MKKVTIALVFSCLIIISIASLMTSPSYAAAPYLSSVTPSSGRQGDTMNITLRGRNFLRETRVYFGVPRGAETADIRVNRIVSGVFGPGDSEMVVNITISPTARIGYYDMAVSHAGGINVKPEFFSVVGIPMSVIWEPYEVTFCNFPRTFTMEWRPVGTATSYEVEIERREGDRWIREAQLTDMRSTSRSVTFSGDTQGRWRVRAFRDRDLISDWSVWSLFRFITVPRVRSVTPASGVQGGSADVTIRGAGFCAPVTVSFGPGISVVGSPVVESPHAESIRTTIRIAATASTGPRNVSVTKDGRTGTGRGLFRVEAAPTVCAITSVNPSSAVQGWTGDVTIRGYNLSGATAVSFGDGITINRFTVVSSTEIRANITISRTAVLVPRDVSVTTPRGTCVGRGLLRVDTPLL